MISRLSQLNSETRNLVYEQETILRKLESINSLADELLIPDGELNDALARAISTASEAHRALIEYGKMLRRFEEPDPCLPTGA